MSPSGRPGAKFPPVSDQPDSAQRELALLEFWKRERIFERSLAQTADGPRFSFFEGPPTANGKPGVHHVLARSFKDLYPRFWTMRGYHVRRKAGWDTHGLPVEHEIERELGIFDKSRLESEVGIAEFTRRCRESVFRYVSDWNRMTERMAYWVDLGDAYMTLSNQYIESVWWLLKQLWERGLIQQDYKVVPYDPRIGATLSDHELAQGYKDVDDPSLYVRFRLRSRPQMSLLAWTTTPWTLPANMALAVHPDVSYCVVENSQGEELVVAEPLLAAVFRDEAVRVMRRVPGSELAGMEYEPLYDYCRTDKKRHYVVAAPFVTTDAGTGIVHMAPAYGADDLNIAKTNDLPVYHSVDLGGHVIPEVSVAAGLFFKAADKPIVADLSRRGLAFRVETHRHSYPFGWRTGDPLIYYAKTAWFIRTTEYREQMLANNEAIHWVPESIKHGRFGNWLENNVDWALSRERFWGTPLPLWTDGENYICMGSLRELEQRCGRSLGELDLHRPAIDEVSFVHAGRKYRRVPEVIDAWFDSGAMPYAQWHYPFADQVLFTESFPADFICEAVDQTRGWFYSLHAIATMLFHSPAYKNVICLGHVVDAAGEKMSKSKGNILDPYEVFDTLGADALRWYFYAATAPGAAKRVSVELVAEASRGLIVTVWNTLKFFTLYANADGIGIPQEVPFDERCDMDRWAGGRLQQLVGEVTQALENYDAQSASRAIDEYADELSNWYVRLSRGRFWGSEVSQDKLGAYRTLYECLCGLALLLAPFTPFLAESAYQHLVRPLSSDAQLSVHLARWPVEDRRRIDAALIDSMRVTRQAVDLGRQARAAAKVKTRQPLATAFVRPRNASDAAALTRFRALILDELNVKDLQVVGLDADFIEYALRPNLPRLGPRLGKKLGAVRNALAAADARAVALAISQGRTVELSSNGEAFVLQPDDILVDSKSAHGFVFAEDQGMLVALDTRLSSELLLEGAAREVVRAVQEARKQAGLDVSDRIRLRIEAQGEMAAAVERWRDYIAKETLALELNGAAFSAQYDARSEALTISLARA